MAQENRLWSALERYIADDEPNANGWYNAYCPLHSDDKRSAGFNFDLGQWKCQKGCGSGWLSDLVDRIRAREAEGGFESEEEVVDLEKERSRRRPRRERPIPSDRDLAGWHRELMRSKDQRQIFFEKRGLNDSTLRAYQIGWAIEHNAFTLPVRDPEGSLLNVRLYRPWELADTKIKSWGNSAFDPNALFPMDQLDEEILVVAEGEWDALMAIERGFPAVSGTTGAEQWQHKWNQRFNNKTVYIVYDRDRAGDKGAKKVAQNLTGVAKAVYIAKLPLPWAEKHGNDITDFFHEEGYSADDFKAVLRDAQVFSAPKDGESVEVTVRESYNPSLAGTAMCLTVHVTGRSENQFLLPKTVEFSCGVNAGKTCTGCPMADNGGLMSITVKPEDDVVLRLINVADNVRNEELRRYLGAHKCGKIGANVTDQTTAEQLIVRTSLDYEDEDDSDVSTRAVINVGQYRTESNSIARLTGTTYPNPKNQQSMFQAWRAESVESSLDTYRVSPTDARLMQKFQVRPGQSPLKKLGEIARDNATNVTHIVNREVLHIAMDLVWHSVIGFQFLGTWQERGWLELLVVGDSRTGKSEIATKLARHYGFGRIVSCESSSIPGLLGTAKQLQGMNEWIVEWGAIPLNDRRLVVLDEVAGLTIEQISQLSSVRSSGLAQIVKAASHETKARTRLIWLSNPRNNTDGMRRYIHGVEALSALIGSQEDLARFDFAMTVGENDVAFDLINRREPRTKTQRYSSEAAHTLLRWVWSRKREQIKWETRSEDLVLEKSNWLAEEYTTDPPLIQGQNIRQKLARLSVAVAARVFSTDAKFECIVVRPEHVESAVKFLDWIYSTDSFGYRARSERVLADRQRAIALMDETKQYLYSREGLAGFLFRSGGEFRRQQMEEVLNLTREEANLIIQKLAGWRMIEPNTQFDYRIQPHLNMVLREMKE